MGPYDRTPLHFRSSLLCAPPLAQSAVCEGRSPLVLSELGEARLCVIFSLSSVPFSFIRRGRQALFPVLRNSAGDARLISPWNLFCATIRLLALVRTGAFPCLKTSLPCKSVS